MPFPTSSWGQANWSDQYTALPTGSGLQLGSTELLFDGSMVQFFQFVASTTANKACTFSGSSLAYTVTPTSATLQYAVTCNDRSGGGLAGTITTVAANSYAWGTIKGTGYPLVTASVAAGTFVVTSSTSGLLKATTAGTDLQANLYNTVVVGGSNAASPVFFG